MKKMRNEKGFTLIEIVMVIVLLGILAAVAIPRFIDLTADAENAAVDGVAGALGSASSINYAARKADSTKGVAIANCTNVANALLGGLPNDGTGNPYAITAAVIAADASATCTVSDSTAAYSATFTALGIS